MAEAPQEVKSEELHLDEKMIARLTRLTTAAPVFAFIKGTPMAPFCKYSKKLIALLKERGILFSAYDVRDEKNQEVRNALKIFAKWPTYPQLWINGKLLGGMDIVQELVDGNEFMDAIPDECKGPTPLEVSGDECRQIIASAPVMLFMKGDVSSPKCGFSNKLITLLQSKGVIFETFDILSNEYIRDAMKQLSEWPTFPQLYVEGKFVGGLDVCNEMNETDAFVNLFPEGSRVKPRGK